MVFTPVGKEIELVGDLVGWGKVLRGTEEATVHVAGNGCLVQIKDEVVNARTISASKGKRTRRRKAATGEEKTKFRIAGCTQLKIRIFVTVGKKGVILIVDLINSRHEKNAEVFSNGKVRSRGKVVSAIEVHHVKRVLSTSPTAWTASQGSLVKVMVT